MVLYWQMCTEERKEFSEVIVSAVGWDADLDVDFYADSDSDSDFDSDSDSDGDFDADSVAVVVGYCGIAGEVY